MDRRLSRALSQRFPVDPRSGLQPDPLRASGLFWVLIVVSMMFFWVAMGGIVMWLCH